MSTVKIIEQVENFYSIIPLIKFRRTPGVSFDNVPMEFLPEIGAMDRVIHEKAAVSPGPVGDVARPWYMHPHQADNLIVLYGTRHVDIFTRENGILNFTVTPDKILKQGKLIYNGPAMLVWPRLVFHRIVSGDEGSASLNFAVHYEGLDMRKNFNIYDLNTETGEFRLLREGFRDQDES
ncbi:hypothetical protein [Desulfonatronovibrio hydrogenovorans]|uniref:hypothetical protein n=1 Tax=Desulfonatronovibrio hydrogenovorans TaxID=53245 RepID=UPI00048E8A3F|nr:hypothetical protein [Desulfonatronovibrio hydrogenovorans]